MSKTSKNIVKELATLNRQIISCDRCPRLVQHRETTANHRVPRFRDWEYWGRPLPGFGDSEAKLLIVGLAPAAHGGNRTGRMFTGDGSGEWLMRALYQTGFANQETSITKDDGLKLSGAYITAAVRCAPPKNKPLNSELVNCSQYLRKEIALLQNVKVVLTLGRIALDTYLSNLEQKIQPRPTFKHAGFHQMDGENRLLVTSYHPSRQNTQTKRLLWDSWIALFERIKSITNN